MTSLRKYSLAGGLRRLRYRLRNWLTCAAILGAVLGLLVFFVDRPTAKWFYANFHSSSVARIAANVFWLIHKLLPAAALVLALSSLAVLLARKSSSRSGRRILAASVASIVSLAVAVLLKFVIGRSQVDPAFLRDDIYTIRPFTLGPDYGAFPSATIAVVSALIIALQLPRPIEHASLAPVVSLLAFSLLVTGGHWLSDIIAGTLLGILLGRAIARYFSLPDKIFARRYHFSR